MIEEPKRYCQRCGKEIPEFLHGGRKYCAPPSAEEILEGHPNTKCKQKFGAKKAKTERDEIKLHFRALLVNRRLLDLNFKSGKTEVNGNDLYRGGFTYQIASSRIKDKQGQFTIPLYIDYALHLISENVYKITYHEPKL